ncbi:MAG TPA: formate dehydrogenase accessory sulfurtransferase FdhD [Actinomycetota bacterium]
MSESRPIGVGFRRPPGTPRPGPTVRARATAVRDGVARPKSDVLATEEPLEIVVRHRGADHQIAVTMRTPGNDFELALGFLFGEAMLAGRDQVATVSYCASGPPEQLYNQVTVELADAAPFEAERLRRNVYATSSCGVCGKASLEAVRVHCAPLAEGPIVDADVISSLPDALRARQKVFERTGGLHAAGLFDAEGKLLLVREDVGRHNAVDKVVGALLMEGNLPASDRILQVSGRASFEIVQKAAVAGIPIVSAVSAPSSLAVDLAAETGMTLAGFVRGDGYNVYSGSSRIRFTNATSSGVSTSSSTDGGAM